MRKPATKLPLLRDIFLFDAGAEGQAIGKFEDLVIFVKGGVPGDVVDVQLTHKKKQFAEGIILLLKVSSPDRTTPFCSHFGICGGCKWQNMYYARQLHFKQKQVIDALTRIGKLNLPNIEPILASDQEQFYRNKLEFTFSHKKWLTLDELHENKEEGSATGGVGFHIPKLFDKVLDINMCYLQSELSNKIRNGLRDFAFNNQLSFYNIRQHTGLLRNLIIRNSGAGGLMVIVCFGENQPELIELVMYFLKTTFTEISSLHFVVNLKLNDTIADQQVIHYSGEDHIVEQMENLTFRISPKSFYQTNSKQAYNLYKVTRDFAGLKGNEIVYDLYTGTGTIANFIARSAAKVIGIEYVADAIKDAIKNAALNNIVNTHFFAGDMKDLLTLDFIRANGNPDVVITDPPRNGMHEAVIHCLLQIKPKKIVYVSCNPSTQARDLMALSSVYTVDRVQPVDMFPHTHHVENVVLLSVMESP